MRTLGVDLGKARIGLALADDVLRTARPLETVKHVSAEADLARIASIAREWEVTRVVVGLPLHMDGTEGPGARHARLFSARLAAAMGVEVVLFDERLSTFEAGERLKERGVPGRAIRDHVDAEAAAVILQGWLDQANERGEDGA